MGSGSNAAQGTIGGAATGASIGTAIMPGIGTAVGAGIGGLAGYFMGKHGSQGAGAYEDRLKQLSEYYKSRAAPQAGPAAQAQNSQFRSNQAGLISQLEAMARGEGPSAATLQMREAMDRAAGSQASAAAGAGGRGVNSGAALRTAMNNTAAVQSQGARDTGMMRTQEQLGAINQLSGTIAQGRAADEGTSQFNAGQTNSMSQANLDAQLRTLGLNDASQLASLQMAMGVAGPSLGQQLMAGGAMALGPGLQYAQGQRQLGMQQQYMNYLTSQRPQQGFQPNYGSDPNYQYASNMAGNMGQPAQFTGLPSQQPQPGGYMQQFLPGMPR